MCTRNVHWDSGMRKRAKAKRERESQSEREWKTKESLNVYNTYKLLSHAMAVRRHGIQCVWAYEQLWFATTTNTLHVGNYLFTRMETHTNSQPKLELIEIIDDVCDCTDFGRNAPRTTHFISHWNFFRFFTRFEIIRIYESRMNIWDMLLNAHQIRLSKSVHIWCGNILANSKLNCYSWWVWAQVKTRSNDCMALYIYIYKCALNLCLSKPTGVGWKREQPNK